MSTFMPESTSDPLPPQKPYRVWNGTRVAKFLAVGEALAMKEYKASLDKLPLSEGEKAMIMGALKYATEQIAEKLVIIALDYGHLLVKNLKERDVEGDGPKDVSRRLILEEDEDECSKGS